ncbi:unnamed protein product [Sphenostylis stenocarpa]|uniref:Uncharacterized protein n=1 Tax=Sphenostylis stenocarpa TaxID=92480 RepID=A0AA87B944_9FABA|nr:unnamed protein product [Sphenostylis stenocarpa]
MALYEKLFPDSIDTLMHGAYYVGSSPAAINFGVTLSDQQLAWYIVRGTPQYLKDYQTFVNTARCWTESFAKESSRGIEDKVQTATTNENLL